jgi:hypothetical protein
MYNGTSPRNQRKYKSCHSTLNTTGIKIDGVDASIISKLSHFKRFNIEAGV